MVIRCERCSTLYELDESLLAPTGSEVQCTKCQHVFTAFPPRSEDRTPAGSPAEPAAPEAPPEAAAPPSPPAPSARAARPAAPAVYRSAASAPTVAGRAPLLKRDTVGAFEARLRWSARWRWLAPTLVATVAVVAAAGWLLLARRGDPSAARDHAEALALVALDDAVSLDEAAARLDRASRRAPKLGGAAADRALALALRAAALLEERDALAAKLSARTDERERLRREEPAGWQDAERAAATEVAALEPEVRARDERARTLSSAATEQLRAVEADVGETQEVVRAAAVLHIVRGDRDQGPENVRSARERARRDPWLDLADGWMDARDPDRAIRERALVRLGALAGARPDLLRGRYLLARAQASLGRRAEALATADGILAANPRHEGARRLREEMAAPPAPPRPGGPATGPSPTGKAAPHLRKSVPQGAPAASAPALDAGPGGAAAAGTAGDGAAPTPTQAPPAPAGEPPRPQPPPPEPAPAPPRPARSRPPADVDGSHGG